MRDLDEVFREEEELFLKNVTLTTEFNKYLVEHPEFAERIPQNCAVVLLPEDNPEFCRKVMALIDHHREIDDVRGRPIVYVKVEKLAPAPPSRLVNPRVEAVVA